MTLSPGKHPVLRQQNPNNPKKKRVRKPSWLKAPVFDDSEDSNYAKLKKTVKSLTCDRLRRGQVSQHWRVLGGADGTATATIMIMGDTCTRGCRFCSVGTSKTPPPLDPEEPEKIAAALSSWGLGYVVLTSVDRDDLEDQGSNHIAQTIEFIKETAPDMLVECLQCPDFPPARLHFPRRDERLGRLCTQYRDCGKVATKCT